MSRCGQERRLPRPHLSPLCRARRNKGGREARLRRLSGSAVTLRVEDPGPCAPRETKATTKEVAVRQGEGAAPFQPQRSGSGAGASSRHWGSLGGGVSDLRGLAAPLRTARD